MPTIETVVHFGSGIGLRREFEERYVILHRNVFPGVLARIRASNIRNYTIFLAGGKLFAHYEYVGTKYAADMAAMGDPITKDWWKLTDPMQIPLRGRKQGEWWSVATMLGHFGGDVSVGRDVVRGCIRAPLATRATAIGKALLDTHRQTISSTLRRNGFRNAGVYHVGGHVHCYYEHNRNDLAEATIALEADGEFRDISAEIRRLLRGDAAGGATPKWEPMREVFHTD